MLKIKKDMLSTACLVIAAGMMGNSSGVEIHWNGPGGGHWDTASYWSSGTVPTSSDSVVFDGGQSCMLDGPSTVGSITFTSAWTFSLNFNGKKLTIFKHADLRFRYQPGLLSTDTIEFAGNADHNLIPPDSAYIVVPAILQNGSATTAVTTNNLHAKALAVVLGTFNLGGGLVDSVGQINGFAGGTIDFGSSTLRIGGPSADFSAFGAIVAGSGKLEFTGIAPHALIPKSGATFPEIVQNAPGSSTTVTVNTLTTAALSILSGTFALGTPPGNAIIVNGNISTSGGTLDFGASPHYVLVNGSTVDLSGLAGMMNAINGLLYFQGAAPQTFMPNALLASPDIMQNGTGGTTVVGNPLLSGQVTVTTGTLQLGAGTVRLVTNSLTINSGAAFNFGTGGTHDTIVNAFAINGGSANLGAGNNIDVKNLSGTGSLQSGMDTLTITGTADFSAISPFICGSGTVVIKSQGMKRAVFSPGNTTFNNLVLWNNGAGVSLDTIDVGAGSFTVNGDLVFRDNKSVSAPDTSVWRFNVGNPSVTVYGNVKRDEMFAGNPVSSVPRLFMGNNAWTCFKNVYLPIGFGTARSASLMFGGANGVAQRCSTFIANPMDSLGSIYHLGTDTLRIANPLKCMSFSQNAGILDLNGMNMSVTGDFIASGSNGANFAPLGGSTITFGGDAHIYGSSTNMANLVGGSMYNISVASGHSLTADWARIADCSVNGGAGTGYATNSRRMNVNTFGWNISGMTLTWTGSAGTSYKNPANWSPALVPADSDNIVFGATGAGRNCQLDTSTGVKNIAFNSGYNGTFDFYTGTLTVSGNADFSYVNNIVNSGGALRFFALGASHQYFTPKAAVMFPRIIMDGTGGPSNIVEVTGASPLTAGAFVMNYGAWNWGYNGTGHTVYSLKAQMPSAVMDFGNSTVRVQDSLYLGCTVQYSAGGLIDLVKGTGTQCVYSWDTLPGLRHKVLGTVKLIQNNLACQAFEHDSGSVALNGYNIVTTGDLVFNAGSATFSDLAGRKLISGGRMYLNGNPGDSIIVNGGVPKCTLAVNGTLTANYAVIGSCIASVSAGHAANSRDAGGNSNWNFLPAGIKKWAAGANNNYWSEPGNWLPSGVPTAADSVVFDNTSTISCMLDAAGSAKAVTFVSGSSMFQMGPNTLTIFGSADFSGCGYIMNSGGVIAFGGNGPATFTPCNGGSMPSIRRASGNGTLTIAGNALNCDTLSVLSGTVSLGTGLAHTVQALLGNSGATLNFGSNTSIAVWRDADLSNMNIAATAGDSLIFNGYFSQTFSPPASATNLTVDVQKNDTLFLGANNLQAGQLVMIAGGLNLGTGHSHSVNSLQCYGGVLNFGSSTLSVAGTVDFSGAQDVIPGSGTLSLTQASGYQYVYEPFLDTLPSINHSGAAAFVLMNPIVCLGLAQNNGQLSLNYQNLTTLGNLTITNGTAASIAAMGNDTLTVLGNATIASSGTPLNLNAASPWSFSVEGIFSITNAVIGKCSAAGSASWPMLASCVDSGGNTRFDFISPAAIVTSPANAAFLHALSSISGTAFDAGSGVSKVRISLKRLSDGQYWDGTKWGSVLSMIIVGGTTSWSYSTAAVPLADGGYVIHAQAVDNAQNQGAFVTDSFAIKTTGPSSPMISIINNTKYTNASSVQLSLSAAGADSMRMQLNANGWAAWEAMAASKTCSITAGGEGLKTISAQYKDKAGNATPIVADSIIYDITPPQSPSIAIVDNNGRTGSQTPQLALSAAGADSMHFQLNGGVWGPWEQYATVKNNFDISPGGNGQKSVAVVFKDRAGNSSTMAHDSTSYDSRLPAINSVTILDSNGYINTDRPKVQIAAVNADSLRIALTADTATASWRPYATLDSTGVAAGGEGLKKVWAQVKTLADVRSAWVFDSTVRDTTPPRAVLLTRGSFGIHSWPGMIAGTSSDPGSGVKSVSLVIQSRKDTTFWNGNGWSVQPAVLAVAGPLANWAYSLPGLKIGVYQAWCRAVDSAGNVQQPDTAVISVVNDSLPPAPVALLRATPGAATRAGVVILSWEKSASPDAESLEVSASAGIPLTGRTPGKFGTMLAADRTSDTLVNLPMDGSRLYYAVSVRDSLGNWSVFAPDSIRLKDTVAPVNHYTVMLSSLGDTAIKVSWTVDPARGDAASVMFGYAKFALTPLTTPYPYRDTSIIAGPVTTSGLWRVLTYLMDSSGNTSPARFDTITITLKPPNTPPVLSSWSLPDSCLTDSLVSGRLAVSDTDAADSITLSWSTRPSWIAAVALPRAGGGLYTFSMTGRPQEKDTGWNRLNFGVFDKAGLAFMVYDSIFVKAKPKAPVVVIRADQTKLLNAAARFVLGTQNAPDTGMTFEAVLRALDDTSYVRYITSKDGTIDLYPLCDGRYELFATVTNARGLRDSLGLRDTFTVRGATTHRFAGPLAADTAATSWQMVSFPTRAMNVPSASPLGALFHWDEQAGERDIYGYYHRVSETGRILPGLGYWRKATDTNTVVIPRSSILDSVVNITLYKGDIGWNQVASPFPYPVAFPYQGILWQWNDTTHDFQEAGGAFNPWQGYWVMADSTTTIHLANKPLFVAPALSKKNIAKFADKNNWQVCVKLNGATNTDAENTFGFSADAQNGYDACDAAKPPRMSDYQYMFFSHPEWKRGCSEYARDIRRTLNRVEAYTIGITPGNGKQSPAISFSGCAKVSSSAQVYLADGKDIIQVEEGRQYAIEKANTVMYRTLFVTTDRNFLRNFPHAFDLGLPYPNPTRRMATLQYSLPYHIGQAGVLATEPYKVSIVLYDMKGRQVRQIVSMMKDPGNYSAWWDGKNNAGLYVAAGMYFCKLNAGSFEAVKRISVVR